MEESVVKFINTFLSLLGISSLAAASRTILSEDKRTFSAFIRGLVLAGFVGMIVGMLIHDFGWSAETQSGVVGIAAFVADDVLLFVINAASKLRKDPMIIINYILGRRDGN